MALIEIYHVVADMYAVDPDWTTAINEGEWVALTTSGTSVYAQRADGSTDRVIGVAGDTMSNTTPGTPYAAQLVVNAAGATRWTQNRVSDFFNETLASGKITVYTGGGKFATDKFVGAGAFAAGTELYVSTAGLLTSVDAGNSQVVAVSVAAAAAYPSGVPGTDTTDGSLSLGDYLTFIMA